MNRLLLPLLLLPLLACEEDPIVFVPEAESLTRFDGGLDGWVPTDAGLAAGSSFSVSIDDGAARFEIDAAAAGGEAVLAREYILTPEVDYVVIVQFVVESSDGATVVDPWTVVAGTSVEGANFQFTDAGTTQTQAGALAQTFTLSGELQVTAGLEEDDEDFESPIRVGIGFRPLTDGVRTYRIDEILVQFIRADVAG